MRSCCMDWTRTTRKNGTLSIVRAASTTKHAVSAIADGEFLPLSNPPASNLMAMSTLRRRSIRTLALEKAASGRALCRWCRGEVKPPRRTFCSDPCVHEWRIRSDPGYVRELLERRDKGVCAVCGLNTKNLRHQALKKRQRLVRARQYPRWRRVIPIGVLDVPLNRSLWEADHIVPVAEGGGECDLANFRTLCLWCHRRATSELRSRIAVVRRGTVSGDAQPATSSDRLSKQGGRSAAES
jgi:5-methylcytosine-specific restriction enzyme A